MSSAGHPILQEFEDALTRHRVSNLQADFFMAGPDSLFRFKYYPLDKNGNLAALWRKKGSWDGEVLTLSRDEYPIEEVLDVVLREHERLHRREPRDGRVVVN